MTLIKPHSSDSSVVGPWAGTALCPRARTRVVGILSYQGPYFGPRGLDMLLLLPSRNNCEKMSSSHFLAWNPCLAPWSPQIKSRGSDRTHGPPPTLACCSQPTATSLENAPHALATLSYTQLLKPRNLPHAAPFSYNSLPQPRKQVCTPSSRLSSNACICLSTSKAWHRMGTQEILV